jgi:tRNA uridine 5-carboxymethylaminomethyl modification enzyme
VDIQIRMVRSIEGLSNAEILRPGYAIEYDYINPVQLRPTQETKLVEGLFHAGQINGTSGYEEAAAQGLLAGINAVLKVRGDEPLILSRSQAYIGVLIDDLVTKGTREPYRMFTSRAEYRLLLREDNADFRLRSLGHELGLVPDDVYRKFLEKKECVEGLIRRLNEITLRPEPSVLARLKDMGTAPIKNPTTLGHLLRRPDVYMEHLVAFDPGIEGIETIVKEEAETRVKYEGYILRQEQDVERMSRMENSRLPEGLDYKEVYGLTTEVREKLDRVRPISLGQASRISGVTPAAIMALQIHFKKHGYPSSHADH